MLHTQKLDSEVRRSKETQTQTKEEKAFTDAKKKLHTHIKRTYDRYGGTDGQARVKPGEG
ncbi:hypothetical protein EON63_18830 [archaeon]|nr:MAG: hypothetical protein EON63_18830 [archaeon]